MSGQIAADKKKISLVIKKSMLKRLDGYCEEHGMSRPEVVSAALEGYLSGGDLPGPAAQYDALMAKLDAISAQQEAGRLAQSQEAAALMHAVREQPIQVVGSLEGGSEAASGDDAGESAAEDRPGLLRRLVAAVRG